MSVMVVRNRGRKISSIQSPGRCLALVIFLERRAWTTEVFAWLRRWLTETQSGNKE